VDVRWPQATRSGRPRHTAAAASRIAITVGLVERLSVLTAWQTKEVSANPGGLIRWPLDMLVPIGFGLLALQSRSELFKRLAFLTGHGPDPHAKPEKSDEDLLLDELKLEAEERDAEVRAKAAPGAAS